MASNTQRCLAGRVGLNGVGTEFQQCINNVTGIALENQWRHAVLEQRACWLCRPRRPARPPSVDRRRARLQLRPTTSENAEAKSLRAWCSGTRTRKPLAKRARRRFQRVASQAPGGCKGQWQGTQQAAKQGQAANDKGNKEQPYEIGIDVQGAAENKQSTIQKLEH